MATDPGRGSGPSSRELGALCGTLQALKELYVLAAGCNGREVPVEIVGGAVLFCLLPIADDPGAQVDNGEAVERR